MKFLLFFILSACFFQVFSQKNEFEGVSFDDDVHRMNEFGFELYDELNVQETNFIISSFSLSVVFSMLENGAEGTTSDEINNVAHLQNDREERNDSYKAMFNYLKQDTLQNGVFNWAVRVFLDDQIKRTDDAYSEVLEEYYYSELIDFDFAIERTVNNKIQSWMNESLYKEMQFSSQEKNRYKDINLDLAAVTYLDGEWLNSFDGVRLGKFLSPSGDSVSCKYLHAQDYPVKVKVNPDFVGDTIFEIPFRGNLSFQFLKEADSSEVSRGFSYQDYQGFIAIDSSVLYDIQLPQLNMDKIVKLEETLNDLGMRASFSGNADFRSISKGLQLREVWHESFLSFDSFGKQGRLLRFEDSPNLIVNKPFRFFVKGQRSDILLFMGVYTGIQ